MAEGQGRRLSSEVSSELDMASPDGVLGEGRPPSFLLRSEGEVAYRRLGEWLRAEIRSGRYQENVALPTETAIAERFGISRQTVRHAFQSLVAEGLVYRVRGRGTFAVGPNEKFLRTSETIEDLMALAVDTELEIISVPEQVIDLEAAGRLRLNTDEVVRLTTCRFHKDRPFCFTTSYFPVEIGSQLYDVPELSQVGVRQHITVLSVMQRATGCKILGAYQSVSAVTVDAGVSERLESTSGSPVLRIDRLYFDSGKSLLELSINHYNPQRYSYRVEIRTSG